MSVSIYPLILEEEGLPFIVCGIGSQESQCHIVRNEGYPLHQIIFSAKGQGILKVNNKQVIIEEGDYFYLKPYEVHAYEKISEVWSTDWLLFRGEGVQLILDKLSITHGTIRKYSKNSPLKRLFNEIMMLYRTHDGYKSLLASSVLYRMVIEMGRESQQDQPSIDADCPSSVERVIAHIDAHFADELTLQELATISGVTGHYLCKIFKERMLMRPFEYVARKRIQEAKQLLLQEKLTVNEISQRVGYKDTSYFCVQFKKYEHVSPNTFRGGL